MVSNTALEQKLRILRTYGYIYIVLGMIGGITLILFMSSFIESMQSIVRDQAQRELMKHFVYTAMFLALMFAASLIIAGYSLIIQRGHFLCRFVSTLFVVLCIPVGTILGLLTLYTLSNSAVKTHFKRMES